ncbi:hypothetical protein [Bacteroides acidifaciens]|nr:hypothetical protein [Bacteroides acidifaciens]
MKSPNPKNNRNPKGLQPNQTEGKGGEIRPPLSFYSFVSSPEVRDG